MLPPEKFELALEERFLRLLHLVRSLNLTECGLYGGSRVSKTYYVAQNR